MRARPYGQGQQAAAPGQVPPGYYAAGMAQAGPPGQFVPPGQFTGGQAFPGAAPAGQFAQGWAGPGGPGPAAPGPRGQSGTWPGGPVPADGPTGNSHPGPGRLVDDDPDRVLTPTTIFAPGSLVNPPDGGEAGRPDSHPFAGPGGRRPVTARHPVTPRTQARAHGPRRAASRSQVPTPAQGSARPGPAGGGFAGPGGYPPESGPAPGMFPGPGGFPEQGPFPPGTAFPGPGGFPAGGAPAGGAPAGGAGYGAPGYPAPGPGTPRFDHPYPGPGGGTPFAGAPGATPPGFPGPAGYGPPAGQQFPGQQAMPPGYAHDPGQEPRQAHWYGQDGFPPQGEARGPGGQPYHGGPGPAGYPAPGYPGPGAFPGPAGYPPGTATRGRRVRRALRAASTPSPARGDTPWRADSLDRARRRPRTRSTRRGARLAHRRPSGPRRVRRDSQRRRLRVRHP